MTVFRSYFQKNNTLIEDNVTNNSQNPVTEISYGTLNSQVSRFIFEIDLEPLIDRINDGTINPNKIQSHVLNLTNTIRVIPDLVGTRFADNETQRAASFELELFNIDEDWDEGNGYDFVYIDEQFPQLPEQASNWFDRKTDVSWTFEGAYTGGTSGTTGSTGGTLVLASQEFEDGSENFTVDITDYINSRIFSGFTGFTATTFGLGIKFTDDLEALDTLRRQAVAFHAKDTHTFYEPYVETIVDDTIIDDRNYFYMDKDNDLYLYANAGNNSDEIIVTGVTIIDYQGNDVVTVTGDTIEEVRRGVFRININIDSDAYPDAVIFTDRWGIIQNGKLKDIDQKFYLINQDKFYTFDLSNRINFDNYFFNVIGILDSDRIRRGDIRIVEVDVRNLYPNQNNNLPLDLEYRIYVTQDATRQIDVIPFTKLDRTSVGYEFTLDTSWLIPQDYFLEVKISNGRVFNTKKPLRFTVLSDGVIA